MKAIIFDLDQTLIDSWFAKPLRKSGKWIDVYKLIPKIKIFDGVNEILKILNKNKILIAIVSSNPKEYCSRIINYFKWDIQLLVSCNDVTHVKPHPEPFILVSKILNIKFENIISVGDQGKDILASQSCSILSIAALWGSKYPNPLLSANPDYICKTTKDLKDILVNLYSLDL